MRFALNRLASVAPTWVRTHSPLAWFERYGARMENYRFPKTDTERQALSATIGADGFALLQAVYQPATPVAVRAEPAVEVLRGRKLELLTRFALMQSQSADYIRDSQLRMLVQPILALLLARVGNRERLVAHLRELVRLLRETKHAKEGNAGGNWSTCWSGSRGICVTRTART
jgi:hypothetical protein